MWTLALQLFLVATPVLLVPMGGAVFFSAVEHLVRLWRIRRNVREGRKIFDNLFGRKPGGG